MRGVAWSDLPGSSDGARASEYDALAVAIPQESCATLPVSRNQAIPRANRSLCDRDLGHPKCGGADPRPRPSHAASLRFGARGPRPSAALSQVRKPPEDRVVQAAWRAEQDTEPLARGAGQGSHHRLGGQPRASGRVGRAPGRSALRGRDAGRRAPVQARRGEGLPRPGNPLADGVTPPLVGAIPLEVARRFVDEIVTVSEAEIVAAMALLITRAKLYVEGSGAAASAALLSRRVRLPEGALTVAVVSGGNVDLARACTALQGSGG